MTKAKPNTLTIAGSDSGGGAGIQADLKTFHALGTHGLTAITAVTSQNTRGVDAVHTLPLAHVRSQVEAVFADFPIAGVKTGMLGSAAITRLVAKEMAARQPPWLVVDPVMIATSGARLLDENALEALVTRLIPLADILTPNLPEAEALVALAGSDFEGVLHVGGRERLSRFEFMSRVVRALDLDGSLVASNSRTDAVFAEPRPADLSLDTTRLASLFPHLDRPPIEEAVRRMTVDLS